MSLGGSHCRADAIERQVGLLRVCVGVSAGVSVASDNDNDAMSIRMIVPRELESVEEEPQQQRKEEEERRSRRAELARPRTPERR